MCGTQSLRHLKTFTKVTSPLGSRAFSVGVRVPMPAPRRSKLYIACPDFLQKSKRAHAAARPFQPRFAPLDSRLVLGAH